MAHSTDIRLNNVSVSSTEIDYRTPIKFGGRVVVDVTVLDVTIDVETRDGRQGRGCGSRTMSKAWGCPSNVVSGDNG